MSTDSQSNFTRNKVRKAFAKNGISVSADAADIVSEFSEPDRLVNFISSATNKKSVYTDDVEAAIKRIEVQNTHEQSSDTSLKNNRKRKEERNEKPDKESASKHKKTTGPSAKPVLTDGDGPFVSEASAAVRLINAQREKTDYTVDKFNTGAADGLQEKYPEVITNLTLDDYDFNISDSNLMGVSIEGDITGNSRTQGEIKDFTELFRDRKRKIEKILSTRISPGKISNRTSKRFAGKGISLCGIVKEKRMSRNQNPIIILEDETGEMPVVFADRDDRPDIETNKVIKDSVIGVDGKLSQDGQIVFGERLYFPGVSNQNTLSTADRDVEAAFISDIHLGSEDFAYEKWKRFIEWAHNRDRLEYLFIAGDLVEGIGVYPGQEEELDVPDIDDQMGIAARTLRQLPEDLTVVCSVGNHDPVRLSEPQPTFKDEYTDYFPSNVTFTGNPSYVTVEENVTVLLYHGMSIHPISESVRGFDPEEPCDSMKLMLRLRHLAPIYGSNVRLAPEPSDYLVIESVPDIFQTGHVHKYDEESYENIKMFNTASWQHQTSFQKQKGISPDVGVFPVVNLQSMTRERISL